MTRRAPAQLSWLAGLLAVYLIAPFVAGVAQLGLADWRTVDWIGLGDACAVSLASATLATLLVAVGGIPLGYRLARTPGRWMALLGFTVQLPLALPPLSSGVLLLFLLGYASPMGRLTGGALTDSFAGIVLAEAFVAAPFLIIAARSAFASLDPVLEDVAATLGHRAWSIFMRVSLPIVGRSIAAGMLLAWLRAFGEFGATVMVAYHPYSLPVYTYVAFGSQGLPAMLPVLLPTLLTAVGVMAIAGFIGTARKSRGPVADPIMTVQPVAEHRPADRRKAVTFAFRRELAGFALDVSWRTDAPRLGILGASGSGKSMTLRLIAGLDRVPHGMITVAGRDLSNYPPDQREVAYVPQNYGLFPHMPVGRQIRFGIGSNPELAHDTLRRLGLADLWHRLPGELSLGQQQRVALVRAFSRPSALLLLDEPFSALDAPLRAQLRRELRMLQQQVNATTILVTHDPEEAFLLADELLILEGGRVLQSGPVEDVFARPVNESAARLLGADNIAHGDVLEANRIDIGGGVQIVVTGPALQPGARVGWAARPDSIRVVPDGCFAGRVLETGPPVGGRREVTLRLGSNRLRAVVEADGPVSPGPCRVSIHPFAIQVWSEGSSR